MEESATAGAAQHQPSRDSGDGGHDNIDNKTNGFEDGLSATPPRPERRSLVPPYWELSSANGGNNRDKAISKHASVESLSRPSLIRLEDHTDEGSEQCKALWAKRVTIDDYVIVSGSAPGVGSYVVWNCTVETLDVSPLPDPAMLYLAEGPPFRCSTRALRLTANRAAQ
jgi:hypothetical protein